MFLDASEFFNLYLQAGSLHASKDLLFELASHSDPRIRRRVSENPIAPTDLLRQLCRDPDPDVRIAVGTNNSSPQELKALIAADLDPTVRLGLAQDPGTSPEILQKLMMDEHPYVSHEAAKSFELSTEKRTLRHIDKFSMQKHRKKGAKADRKRA